MKVFDQIDPSKVERREWHLWLLALTVILVLTVGMALLMYPTVFSHPVVLSGPTQRKAFFGFCALSILLLGYLGDRQLVISHLRKRLAEEHKLIIQIRHEASTDLLGTLPGFEHFQDRLMMEYRRAVATHRPLSIGVIALKSTPSLAATSEVSTAFGDAAKAMIRKLRGEDSIYLFSPGVFCMLLPGVDASKAHQISDRLTEGLKDASGASTRFSFDVQILNYPDHAATAREIEDAVCNLLPEGSPAPVPSELRAMSTGAP